MQLEELQEQWRRLDRKLDRSLEMEAEIVRQVVMQPTRRRVHRLAIWPAIDVAFGVGVLLLAGSFLGDHWRDWRAVVPAAVVMIGAAALLSDSIRQLMLFAGLDWCGPVAEIQRVLGLLRGAKIRQFKWIILLSPLVGFCGLMVGLQEFAGWLSGGRADILDKIDPRWVAANYAFGVLFVPAGYFVARALAERCHRHRWWQATLDDISGRNLKAAARDVEHWASLQLETSDRGD